MMLKRWLLASSLLIAPSAALAAPCAGVPYSFVNGTVAQAPQVNANFSALQSCITGNSASNGVNSDITALLGLTTPLSTAQGGTGNASGITTGVFGLSQNGLGAPGGAASGYAAGDTVTLTCTGVTFSTAPVIGITAVSAGAPTSTTVSYPGATNGPVSSLSAACSQASTTGSGTGYTVSATLSPLAAYVAPALLGTGGGAANGNLFMNAGDLPLHYNAGAENTFIGDKSGFGLYGASSYNAALGHNACGYGGGTTGVISSYNTCLGNDAGRNVSANASFGSNTLIGYGTGRNMAGGFNTYIGSTVASSSGVNNPGLVSGSSNTGVGYQVANAITTGVGNTLLGQKTGSQLVAGSGNLILSANSGAGDVCADGDTQNQILLCSGQGIVVKTQAGASDPTTGAFIISGSLEVPNIVTSAGSGGLYVCVDSSGQFYKKSSCP